MPYVQVELSNASLERARKVWGVGCCGRERWIVFKCIWIRESIPCIYSTHHTTPPPDPHMLEVPVLKTLNHKPSAESDHQELEVNLHLSPQYVLPSVTTILNTAKKKLCRSFLHSSCLSIITWRDAVGTCLTDCLVLLYFEGTSRTDVLQWSHFGQMSLIDRGFQHLLISSTRMSRDRWDTLSHFYHARNMIGEGGAEQRLFKNTCIIYIWNQWEES